MPEKKSIIYSKLTISRIFQTACANAFLPPRLGKKNIISSFLCCSLIKYKWFSKRGSLVFECLELALLQFYQVTYKIKPCISEKNVKLIAHHASKIEFTENSIHIVYNQILCILWWVGFFNSIHTRKKKIAESAMWKFRPCWRMNIY